MQTDLHEVLHTLFLFSKGQEDSKHNQPMSREEPFLKDESKTTSTRAINGGRAKLALPVKPDLPTKPHKNKLQNDTDPTLVKPKVTLPVRNQDLPTDDASNSTASAISPRILNTGFQRPVAKIEPYARNEHENTDPKTVIQSEETALKSPARSTIVEGEVHAETEPVSLGGDLDETLVKNAHETSQQTLRENSIERPTQTIQSLMHLQALEKSGQMDKSHNDKNNNNNSDTCRKQESCGRPLFQAPPFSTFRRSDALTLFYKNRPDVKGEALNETVAINNLNFSDLSEADSVRQRSLTHQSMPLGEDPLSHLPGSMNASLLFLDERYRL